MPWLSLTIRGLLVLLRWFQASLPYISVVSFLIAARLLYLLMTPYPKGRQIGDGQKDENGQRRRRQTCRIAIFLGSGGHTTEMLQLLSALPAERYTPRIYISASGDRFSTAKAIEAEKRLAAESTNEHDKQTFSVLSLPRARNVHQTWLSTPLSLALSLAVCMWHIVVRPTYDAYKQGNRASNGHFADLILMNGPGTCVPIVAAVYVLRVSMDVLPANVSQTKGLTRQTSSKRQILGLPSPRLMYVESFARVRSLSLTGKILRFFVDTFIVQWNQGSVARGAYFHGCLV